MNHGCLGSASSILRNLRGGVDVISYERRWVAVCSELQTQLPNRHLKGNIYHRSRYPAKDYRNNSLAIKRSSHAYFFWITSLCLYFQRSETVPHSSYQKWEFPSSQRIISKMSQGKVSILGLPYLPKWLEVHQQKGNDTVVLILFTEQIHGSRYFPPNYIRRICFVLPSICLQWFSMS